MSERKLDLTVFQMSEAIRNIRQFTDGMQFEDFKSDAKARHAVERCIEIVSEAARRMPLSVQDRHPEIPWQDIKRIGNVLRHRYDDVDSEIIWDIVNRHLEPLERTVARIAAEHDIDLSSE